MPCNLHAANCLPLTTRCLKHIVSVATAWLQAGAPAMQYRYDKPKPCNSQIKRSAAVAVVLMWVRRIEISWAFFLSSLGRPGDGWATVARLVFPQCAYNPEIVAALGLNRACACRLRLPGGNVAMVGKTPSSMLSLFSLDLGRSPRDTDVSAEISS